MEMTACIPNIRFADNLQFDAARGPSKTYDCRLLYTLKGGAALTLEDKSFRLRHGCLVIFQPGTRYCILPEDSVTLAVFDFDFTQEFSGHTDFLVPCPADRFQPENAHPRVRISDAPMLTESLFMEDASFAEPTIQKIVAEFHTRQRFWRSICSALFKQLLCEVARTYQTGAVPQELLQRLLAYIDANLHHTISNRELGEALGYNHNYLNRMILPHTGVTLHQYVLRRRLTLATTLLVTTQLSVGEIAARLGFHSSAHFSNYYKKMTGISPAKCRKNSTL